MSHRSGTDAQPEQFPPAEPILPGDDLIEAFRRSGAPADFERVVQRYAPLVFAECRRVTRNGHDAEDAAQLTFLALAIELRAGAELRKPAAWLQRVAQRQALKLVRSRGRRRKREDAARKSDHAPPEPLRLEIAEREQHAGQVRDAIDELPERYRLPLVLHYFGGLSLEGIAGELGIKRQAVGTRLFRARKMLAEQLGKRGITMSDALVASIAATLVPAAVVANLIKGGVPVIAQAAPGAAFAHGIATLVGVAAGAGTRRPAVAAAIFITTAAATGFAWVAPPAWTQTVRDSLDFGAWRRWVTELRLPRPTLAPPTLTGPVAQAEPARTFVRPPLPMPTAPSEPPPILPQAAAASGVISTTEAPQPPTIAATLRDGPFAPSVDLAPPPAASARVDAGWQPRRASGGGRPSRRVESAASIDRPTAVAGDATLGAVTVGDRGVGTLDIGIGRTARVAGLTLGAGVGSTGTANVGGGTLEVTEPQTPVVVGGRGTGRLYLGTQDAPGQIVASPGADARLIVRATEKANGLIRGWGTVESGGTLVNNGRIVADGFEKNRSLNLSKFKTVTNSIDNPRDGKNGWYARRGGRVVLPTLQFDADRPTATWGESEDDADIDLVNSVRVTVPKQSRPASMSLTLRTVALNDALDVPLPIGVSVIGLYEVRGIDLDGDAMFTVRYDHAAADSTLSGEFGVGLMAHADGTWFAAGDASLSLYRRTISGTFAGTIDTLAVTVSGLFTYGTSYGWMNADGSITKIATSRRITHVVGASLESVPEPAAALSVALVAGALLRRRRR